MTKRKRILFMNSFILIFLLLQSRFLIWGTTYSYKLNFQGYTYQNFSGYFPADAPSPGSHTYNYSQALNDINSLKTRSYPVPVTYSMHTGGLSGWWPTEDSAPNITIYTCDKNGNNRVKVGGIGGHDRSSSGSLTIPANQGMYIAVHVGCCRASFNYSSDIPCFIDSLVYKTDSVKPLQPTGLTIAVNQNDGGVYIANGITYTKNAPVKLQCDQGIDQGDPCSGVDGYNLYYNNSTYFMAEHSYDDTLSQLFANDGQYTVQLRVKDKEGLLSDPSSYTFVVDRTVNPVTAPSHPIQLTRQPDGTYDVNVTWNPVQDVSGIKKYQLNLTSSPNASESGWVDVPAQSPEPIQYHYTFPSQPVANTPLFIYIRAVDNVNNISTNIPISPFKIWSPITVINATPKAVEQNGRIIYNTDLQLEDNPEAIRYIIEREGPTSISPIILTYQQLKDNGFKYTDSDSFVKHGQYRYSVYTENEYGVISEKTITPYHTMPNVAPSSEISGPRPIEVYTDVTFLLGKTGDLENDTLEYRLYTRTPGVETGILLQSWTPATDGQKVTVSFPDKKTLEWQICCIENDPDIPDRTEVSLTGWNQLYIDTRHPLPHCFNVFGENLWGTKGQELRFEVETNPVAHFANFVWNFGDGGLATGGTETTHAYLILSEPDAPYIVTVTATDDTGVQYTGTIKIHIVNTSKGRLYADETWSGSQTITEDVVVPAGIRLTIEPGTVVQANLGCYLKVNGQLDAIDPGKGIRFTGQSPDSTWQGIRFDGTGTGILDGVTVSRAVRGVACTSNGSITLQNDLFSQNDTGVHCFSGIIKVTGCTFQDNTVYGIKEDKGCNPLVENCIFQGNGIPYYDQNLFDLSVEQLNIEPNRDN